MELKACLYKICSCVAYYESITWSWKARRPAASLSGLDMRIHYMELKVTCPEGKEGTGEGIHYMELKGSAGRLVRSSVNGVAQRIHYMELKVEGIEL